MMYCFTQWVFAARVVDFCSQLEATGELWLHSKYRSAFEAIPELKELTKTPVRWCARVSDKHLTRALVPFMYTVHGRDLHANPSRAADAAQH